MIISLSQNDEKNSMNIYRYSRVFQHYVCVLNLIYYHILDKFYGYNFNRAVSFFVCMCCCCF